MTEFDCFMDEVMVIGQGMGDLNILNDKGLNSLHQKLDPKYAHIQILSKNPLIGQLGDDILTNEEYNGASGQYASAFGGASSAQGKRSAAFGTNTVAKGNYSFCCGDNSVTLGNDSFACCYANVAYGIASFAAGSGSLAYGQASFAIGSACKAVGDASFAGGAGAIALGTHSFAHGNGVTTNKDNQVALGKFNRPSEALFVIGDGHDDENRSNAFEVFGGYDQEKYATVGGKVLATERFVNATQTTLTKYIDKQTGTKSVEGEIIEITDLDNRQSAVIDSTVTDNYFYKKNFLVNTKHTHTIFSWMGEEPKVYLKNSTTSEQVLATITRSKYRDGFVRQTTAYIIFTTPANADNYDKLVIDFGTDGSSALSIHQLKPKHSYMVIVSYKTIIDQGYQYCEASFPYLVDYEDSYHWIKGNPVDNIPFPNSIMIPHIGRIDKGDTLTATYTTSEQYKAFFGVDENGNHYINIGNTKVTEEQIKKLLTLIS